MLPGNPRYQPKGLLPYFGYDNLYQGPIRVEIATLRVLGEIGVIPAEEIALLTPELEAKLLAITTTEVDLVERTQTRHDVRAMVRCMQDRIPELLARWVHIPLTSYDPLESGRIMTYLAAYQNVTRPAVRKIISIMADLVKTHSNILMMGRTHGQAALPITAGFWLATILYRLVYNYQEMERQADQLVGKLSGAVGAYNAQVGLGILERCGDRSFESRVLDKLGLKPSPISTQILPPEPLAYFLHSHLLMSATLGQLGRDCRHLMRSGIAEVAEPFEPGQVGSSTMAHKRNPITWEGLEGAWNKSSNQYGNVLDILISEHQRDLVGSSVMRDFPVIVINLQHQLDTLLREKQGEAFLSRLQIDTDSCWRNFERDGQLSVAEPMYIALQMAGYTGDAHELVNHTLVPRAQASGCGLVEALVGILDNDQEVADAWTAVPTEIRDLLSTPENYLGLACKKAMQIVALTHQVLTTT